jgi:catalase
MALRQGDVADLDTESQQRLATQKVGAQEAAAAFPANPLKAGEHGLDGGHSPQPGTPVPPHRPIDTASTVTEDATSPKVGRGVPPAGLQPRQRVARPRPRRLRRPDADDQHGNGDQRQPELAEGRLARADADGGLHPPREDHPLRPRAHSGADRPRARLGGARLLRELPGPLADHARGAVRGAGKRTPVFVRFSTVAGERGSFDLARDVRGFAVKFYTDEGNWDIVGNNIPVFFIQDAMKFPDLVHAVKPEPHNAMPQAASAHDTFWDFVSLMPESTHMLMWVMSDRAIPRSYRMMQGFGVHTFRLVNAAGESRFCKFHWEPVAGTHSVVWDEAVKINGADPDFHRRDLWEAIEAGAYPEWELGLQVFTEEEADRFSFDILDATKIVPRSSCR